MLASSNQNRLKAYAKRLENGFGIKTINVTNGVENILVITSDSNIQFDHSSKKTSQRLELNPLLNKYSQETFHSKPVACFTSSNLAINRILTHLEPYLKELKPDIAGFHIFEKVNSMFIPNIQKTSVIVVANSKLAQEKGVHINIPGKLMKVYGVDKKKNISFEADPVIKPLTIIVGDYILYITIHFDLPLLHKSTGTQTRKEILLESSIGDLSTVYNIAPLFYMSSQTEDKGIQTENGIVFSKVIQSEEKLVSSQTVQTDSALFAQDCTTQTELAAFESFLVPSVTTKMERTEADYPTISNKSELSITNNSSCISLNTFNSHTKLPLFDSHTEFKCCKNCSDTILSHRKIHNASPSYIPDSVVYNVMTTNSTETVNDGASGKINTATLESNGTFILGNLSEYKNAFKGDLQFETVGRNYDSLHHSSLIKLGNKTKNERISMRAGENGKSVGTSKPNISIKQIKQRLDQTTLSLCQLYSVIECIEALSKKSSNENIESRPGVNTIRNICLQSCPTFTTRRYIETLDETNKTSDNVLDNKPPQDKLCNCCSLFFQMIKHHKCIKEHLTIYENSLKHVHTNYKFVDVPQEGNSINHNCCKLNETEPSRTKLNKLNKCGYKSTVYHSFTNKKSNKTCINLKNSRIFYGKKYKTISKSDDETTFQLNSVQVENLSHNIDQHVGHINTICNYLTEVSSTSTETSFIGDINENKHNLQCQNDINQYQENGYRSDVSSEEELFVVMPLTKDNTNIKQSEDTLLTPMNKEDKFIDKPKYFFTSQSLQSNTIHKIKSDFSSKKHMFEFGRQVKSWLYLKMQSKTSNKSVIKAVSKFENCGQCKNELSKITLNHSQNKLVAPSFSSKNKESSSSVVKIFKNNSQFSSLSSGTLNIIPSSEEYIQVNKQKLDSNIVSNFCSSTDFSRKLEKTINKSEESFGYRNDKNNTLESNINIVKSVSSKKNEDQLGLEEKQLIKSGKNNNNKKFTSKKRVFCFAF